MLILQVKKSYKFYVAELGVESKMCESKFQLSLVPVPSFPEFLSILVTLWISTSQSNIFQNLVELNSHSSYNQRKRKKNFFLEDVVLNKMKKFYILGLLRALSNLGAL